MPAWAWLTGIVAASAAVRFVVAQRMPAPWIMVDELIYSELARGIASGAGYALRDEPVGLGYGAVYPLLVSPAFLLERLTDAYAVVKALNAILISLAAVPAYLLARRVVSPPAALVVAALSLAVPSMFYAGTVMTENAFYPVFLTAVLLLLLVLERPTATRTAALLAVLAVAFLTRTQAVVLVPAVATAPLLAAAWRRDLRVVAGYRTLYAGLLVAAGLVLAGAALRGRGPRDLLGAYGTTADREYPPAEVARWLLYHVAELDLYLGIAPFAAFVLLLLVGHRRSREEQLFLAAAAAVSAWLLLQVAAFSTLPFVLRVEERNMFYLAPLFFTALALWIERGAPRPALPTALAAGAAVALPAFLPYPRLIGVSATSDTLAMLPLWWLHETVPVALDRMWVAVLLGAAAVAVLFAFLPRRATLALPAVVLLLYGLAAQPIDARTRAASLGHQFQGMSRAERDWVDREMGRGADVAVLWTGVTDHLTVFENEFFSRSLGDVHFLRDPLPGGLPQRAVAVDERDGLLRAEDGSTIEAPFLFTDQSLPIDGTVVAEDRPRALRVYRLDGPARVESVLRGVYGDLWTEPSFVYRGFGCEEDVLVARLGGDAQLFLGRARTVTASIGGREVARARVRADVPETRMRIPLAGAGDTCEVRFAVTPTAVPAEVRPENADTRELGVRVVGFERR